MSGKTSLEGIGPHRRDSFILLAFLAFAVVGFALIYLGSEVAEGDVFAIDKVILLGLRVKGDLATPIGPAWLKTAMVDFTSLGSTAVLTLITFLVAGYLVAIRKFAMSAFLVASIAVGAIVNFLIKLALARPRPELVPHLVTVNSASFPSGHSMSSATVYLTLAILLARSEDSRRVRSYLIACAILLTLLVGTSRVYLGVHWPSDVLAGWSVGAMWAAGCALAAKLFARRLGTGADLERATT
ncbi:phosphatase PAP2 family protein [Tsuneonella sp. YG55]|uniref:Phosphatase PAP2 family protein n=1 Tax=Tsuneonella litorea TaxID=2976475 RepID=A0A9X2W3R6_9SPHN|nr:phosphatase PAP2 family protein [Tsuneonella litorea]MCT2560197.1 phosphatase PAP2 family protein [Tsuneonella litorea]